MTDARFESGAHAYADYLRTVEGRLRLDIAWANFNSVITKQTAARELTRDHAGASEHEGATQPHQEHATQPGRVLDLGGGTGALALRFAAHGWHASIVDPSAQMLALAADAARAESLDARVAFHQSTAEMAAQLFAPHAFDAAVCHNVLEYVRDPRACVAALAALVKPGAHVSLVARNRAGEALRAALKTHDLEEAERALVAAEVNESLYGGPARLYDARSLRELATAAKLEVVAERGVRVVADYLPAQLSDTPETYARLLSFELMLGASPEFASVARYTQIIARLNLQAEDAATSEPSHLDVKGAE
ncbi:MAG TPA: class I SAM-dependent methyltransferase [Pyrinomonadaceae bacterium]|nr:class I SAM-dependent methyltransferase [Pyrinomonadaceae bacterium]